MNSHKSDDDYMRQLVEGEHAVGAGYDKTIITLSAGALGLSLAFIKDIVPLGEAAAKSCLLASWGLWATSLSSLLIAYFVGQMTYRIRIVRLSKGQDTEGGIVEGMTWTVYGLNAIAGLSFLGGVGTAITFVYLNIGGGNV